MPLSRGGRRGQEDIPFLKGSSGEPMSRCDEQKGALKGAGLERRSPQPGRQTQSFCRGSEQRLRKVSLADYITEDETGKREPSQSSPRYHLGGGGERGVQERLKKHGKIREAAWTLVKVTARLTVRTSNTRVSRRRSRAFCTCFGREAIRQLRDIPPQNARTCSSTETTKAGTWGGSGNLGPENTETTESCKPLKK